MGPPGFYALDHSPSTTCPTSAQRSVPPDRRGVCALPRGVHVNVQEGERVRAGEPLMDGPSNPHDILNVLGEKALHAYLVNEIQEVYRLQGDGREIVALFLFLRRRSAGLRFRRDISLSRGDHDHA
jgi:hypothetical protein